MKCANYLVSKGNAVPRAKDYFVILMKHILSVNATWSTLDNLLKQLISFEVMKKDASLNDNSIYPHFVLYFIPLPSASFLSSEMKA